ncbi:patatin-like phospholipase family protein [Chryseobacterium nepalense]|uniref:Patatin-like phospholipase family protein n=1 Tax=Chryseobacterium nepalense TaxID=1854498 RepID=A0ABY4K679_9FLAO|nr:patatin-like phospholipase family protein [Chryseobacterium nepalense]UPQ76272.1 patatin-like phospholipase family protein [Chryseobacterium nepalense]
MNVIDFTQTVEHMLDHLEKLYSNDSLHVSDIRDNINWEDSKKDLLRKYGINPKSSRQYVDLIQEGGGVHGIALAGYTYILEKMGISFLNSAGTSAGAINTMMLNCVYSRRDAIMMGMKEEFIRQCYETRSEKIIEYLSQKDLRELVDGHPSWRSFILQFFSNKERGPLLKRIKNRLRLTVIFLPILLLLIIVSGTGVGILTHYPASWQIWINRTLLAAIIGFMICIALLIRNITSLRLLYFNSEKMGINPGDNFKEWIQGLMENNGIKTVSDLKRKMLTENDLYRCYYVPDHPHFENTDSNGNESTEKLVNTTKETTNSSDGGAENKIGEQDKPHDSKNDWHELKDRMIDIQLKEIFDDYLTKNNLAAEDQKFVDHLLIQLICGISNFSQINWQDLKIINEFLTTKKFISINNNDKIIEEILKKLFINTKNIVNACGNRFFQQLVVVAADITNQIKVEFPGMHEFYWGTDESISPAEYVRASMSIPFFFKPYKVTMSNTQLININETWKTKLGSYKNFIQGNNEILFVDGGALSNFPINVFYDSNHHTIPTRPTFGIKLEYDNDDLYKLIDNESKLALSMISTMRYFYDRDFLIRNSNFRKTVRSVDTGKISWLNFAPKSYEQIELFYRGALAATIFLSGKKLNFEDRDKLLQKAKSDFGITDFKLEDFVYPDIFFDWENYKKERGMAEIYKNLSPKLKEKSSFTN